MTRSSLHFAPGVIDYNGAMSTHYNAGRSLSPEAAEVWSGIVAAYAGKGTRILDVGAGTGRFAALFAERLGAKVAGIEPAQGMLTAARADRSGARYVRARAEQLPLRDGSCDLAWMSQVLHHLPDRPACARELRRVLRPGGHLLIRGAFGDHVDGFPAFFRFWPRTREVVEQMPTTVDAVSIFAAAGFELREHRRITQQTCASLRECAERSRGRADTSLTLISDEEFYSGLAALEEAAAHETSPAPVFEIIELLIFRNRP